MTRLLTTTTFITSTTQRGLHIQLGSATIHKFGFKPLIDVAIEFLDVYNQPIKD